jgi:protein-arginine kinase activator protein McsA
MSRETFIAEVVRRRHDLAKECPQNAECIIRALLLEHVPDASRCKLCGAPLPNKISEKLFICERCLFTTQGQIMSIQERCHTDA